ncbi:hypothetical protein CDL15_Pgr019725 [Punica granatum]|uniref:Uncharacterized protein n=1 Tax=Punica granatum TaxID=22663 RepID=A0A218X5E5_PUNGR|nr:hypothetical protein CDL15_Pgr019725 [Punica granatum]
MRSNMPFIKRNVDEDEVRTKLAGSGSDGAAIAFGLWEQQLFLPDFELRYAVRIRKPSAYMRRK